MIRKYLLNRKFVFTLALWMAFLSVPPSNAFAMPSDSVAGFNAAAARQAEIEKIMAVLSRPEARAHLVLMGVKPNELRDRLGRLDDEQLASVASRAEEVKVGGDALGVVVALLVIAILVVLLIKLSDKTIEVKDKK